MKLFFAWMGSDFSNWRFPYLQTLDINESVVYYFFKDFFCESGPFCRVTPFHPVNRTSWWFAFQTVTCPERPLHIMKARWASWPKKGAAVSRTARTWKRTAFMTEKPARIRAPRTFLPLNHPLTIVLFYRTRRDKPWENLWVSSSWPCWPAVAINCPHKTKVHYYNDCR